ncbi:atrial natriuretic peptide receptor, putative [Ixodes scapularis]|uniref:Atrial natriuretic peptide receptor, putative n=1 Tax=Ixodes scapularis TaxID=6945 RepID=B7PJ67_IXOSC|nr:atrial natriuretic peptide receptor, putative [Ixodes scapularis]|eukprot:XP_002407220.1 atrial natriuretic peptide receptor, putative [Ixodes scapularis]
MASTSAFIAQVAKRLCQNLPVEAEKFETVSCLFSDIVGFTSMSGSCEPMEIVRLLNHLYLQFDNLSNLHGVYKVKRRPASLELARPI